MNDAFDQFHSGFPVYNDTEGKDRNKNNTDHIAADGEVFGILVKCLFLLVAQGITAF